MIGILPNQIRALLKSANQGDSEFEELSKELFWGGFRLWNKRKSLMSNFWKKIAPEEWKLHKGKRKTENKERKNNKGKKIQQKEQQCQNPFHFLKRHCLLSKRLPTPCFCSRVTKRKTEHRFLDLRAFMTGSHSSARAEPYPTREDCVRGAHDRSKKARHDLSVSC